MEGCDGLGESWYTDAELLALRNQKASLDHDDAVKRAKAEAEAEKEALRKEIRSRGKNPVA